MKVLLETQNLRNCLNYISKITTKSKKSGGSPLYSQVQLDFKNNNLTLYAYDSSYGLQISYGEVNCEDSRYLIDAEGISHVVKYSEQEKLDFDFKETRLVVKDGNSSYKFNYFSSENSLSYIFENISEQSEVLLTTNATEFSKIFKFLDPCIANDAARPFLNGIQFDGNFVAADGNICGVYSNDIKQENTVFLLSESLDLISSLPDNKDILIYKANNLNIIECDNLKMITPQINGAFPNYNKIIDITSNYSYKFAVEKSRLQKVSEKLTPFADIHQRLMASAVFTKDGNLQLAAASEGTKEGLEIISSIEAVSPKEDITFYLNIRLLASLVRSIPSDLIYIKYSDNVKAPLLITDEGQFSNFLSVYNYIKNS